MSAPDTFLRCRTRRLPAGSKAPLHHPRVEQMARYLSELGLAAGNSGPSYLMDCFRTYLDGIPPSPGMMFLVADQYGTRNYQVRRALYPFCARLHAADPRLPDSPPSWDLYAFLPQLFRHVDEVCPL